MRRDTCFNYISRLMACLLVMALLICGLPRVSAQEESGQCGENLTCSFSAGTLTLSGSGAMTDFQEDTMAPWYPLRNQILRLELPQGLSNVGDLAFYGCDKLLAVNIPDSVISIGSYAFAGCTSITMLDLGNSVAGIGECAFSDCVSLAALYLPESLNTIGMKAFYRCESIPAVTVPAGVNSVGMSAFAYCKQLVTADIQAKMDTVPEWLFYGCGKLVSVTLPEQTEFISEFAFRGCEQLSTVYYDGSHKTPEQIQQVIDAGVPGFDSTGHVSNGTAPDSAISGTTYENSDGSATQQNVTVTQKQNTTVSSTVQTTRQEDGSATSVSITIQVTVENSQGWEEAEDLVSDALKSFSENVAHTGREDEKIEVTVFVKDADISPEFLEIAAGRDVVMTIVTQDGSSWRLDGNQLQASQSSGQYDMRYTLTAGSFQLCEELGVGACYVLRFLAPAQLHAEVLIRLDGSYAMQNATLLQRNDTLDQIQSTVIDRQGYAHFYLASVTEQTDYYIAVNMPQVRQEAIIPDEVLDAYGNPVQYIPLEYEITGIRSSWGVNFGQITLIMIAALVICVAAVGFVMYRLNKRKLKRGYIPELDEEDLH